MNEQYEFFAPCPRGLDRVAADEIRAMGIKIRPLQTGVSFKGSIRDAYRVCLFSRTVSRVLMVLARVDSSTADKLRADVFAIAWEEHFTQGATLSVSANGTNDELRNTQFTAQCVKDSICDRLRERVGWRPDVDRHAADIQVSISVRKERATVYLNLSGAPLHQRGYRTFGKASHVVEAPMKEALAAGMLLLADWPRRAQLGESFCDPMCGSGTLAIEAALMAMDVAPGLLRQAWGFTAWRMHDEQAWEGLLAEARERRDAATHRVRIFASDIEEKAIALARENAHRAGIDACIEFSVADVADMLAKIGTAGATDADAAPEESSIGERVSVKPGLVAMNPPYGERLMSAGQLPALYARIGSALRTSLDGWTGTLITPEGSIDTLMSLDPSKVFSLYNGAIPVTVRIYKLDATAQLGAHTVMVGETEIPVLEENSQQYANRLKRRFAQMRKWARRNDVHAYRVYDADLPDYNVAVDVYEETGTGVCYATVAEYAAPSEIDHVKARKRAIDALTITPVVLGIDSAHIVFKRRSRKAEQHADQAVGRIADGQMADARFNAQPAQQRSGKTRRSPRGGSLCIVTEEHGLKFKVNLNEYLDTGLFLDHRPVRALIERTIAEQLERGETQHTGVLRMLNLFAYTGTATVHAVAGGATHTTTVDMSATYLDWARENMALNDFAGRTHTYEQADCLQWLARARHASARWDFIFVDPPTFSNSKRMGSKTWDVQRDHVELLKDVASLLTPQGKAVFSCNLRSFRPDAEALRAAGLELEDITASTIDEDFARNPRIHSCFIVHRIS